MQTNNTYPRNGKRKREESNEDDYPPKKLQCFDDEQLWIGEDESSSESTTISDSTDEKSSDYEYLPDSQPELDEPEGCKPKESSAPGSHDDGEDDVDPPQMTQSFKSKDEICCISCNS